MISFIDSKSGKINNAILKQVVKLQSAQKSLKYNSKKSRQRDSKARNEKYIDEKKIRDRRKELASVYLKNSHNSKSKAKKRKDQTIDTFDFF